MKKYLVVMNFTFGTLNVYLNYEGIENGLRLKDSECCWNYFDELPDFDESLLIDCGESYGYLTIFDFTSNHGITIPYTKDQFHNLEDFVENEKVKYGLDAASDYYVADEPMEYNNII